MSADDELRAEREARIRSLEKRIAKRSPIGVKAPVAIIAIAASAALLSMEWRDLVYFFAARTPTILGREGDYHFDRLHSNSYVQIHGVPTLRGDYALEHGETFVMVGLRDTPVLVHRRALPHEQWQPPQTPPQPDQRSFAVGGRLVSQRDATRYAAAFRHLSTMGEVKPVDGNLWVILEGEGPGDDRGVLGIGAMLLFFLALNAWFLVEGVRRRTTAL